MEGLSVGPPSRTWAPSDANSSRRPGPETTASAPERCGPAGPASARRAARAATCSCMSATSDCRTASAPPSRKTANARSGSSVWTWTLSVLRSPTTRTESPIASSAGTNALRVEVAPDDREVRAPPERLRRVLGMADPRRGVVLEGGGRVAAQRRDDAREDHDHAVAAGVDDARLAQRGQQVRAAAQRRLARGDGPLQHVGDEAVLDRGVGLGGEARLGHVRELAGNRGCHVAHDREHRPLGRRADRGVRALGRPGHGGADQDRVDELARPRDELLGGAADELREDHAAVAARAEQRRAGDRVDDLVAPDLVDRVLVLGLGEAVDLVEAGAQRQRHVVARVAVGDGEDVEVVDLGAPRLEVREGALDRGAEADEAGLGARRRHGSDGATGAPALDGLGDLAGLEAAGADVDALAAPCRRGRGPSAGSGRTGAGSQPSNDSDCFRRRDPSRSCDRPWP